MNAIDNSRSRFLTASGSLLLLAGCGGGARLLVPSSSGRALANSDLAKAVGDPDILQQILALSPGKALTLQGKGPWSKTTRIQPQCGNYLSGKRLPQACYGGGGTLWQNQNGFATGTTNNGNTSFSGASYNSSSGALVATHGASGSNNRLTSVSYTSSGQTVTQNLPAQTIVPGTNTVNGYQVNVSGSAPYNATASVNSGAGPISAATQTNGSDAVSTLSGGGVTLNTTVLAAGESSSDAMSYSSAWAQTACNNVILDSIVVMLVFTGCASGFILCAGSVLTVLDEMSLVLTFVGGACDSIFQQ